jgi:hypothetical protein
MGPAVAIRDGRITVLGVRALSGAAVTIEPELHLDACKIRDRAPCPFALDPICGSLIGHVDLLPGRAGLIVDVYGYRMPMSNGFRTSRRLDKMPR